MLPNATIDIMPDSSEVVHYDNPEIPLYIRKDHLSAFPGKRAQCHWHDEIELILILDGEMDYYVNASITTLKKDEGILINNRQMHYGFSTNDMDCTFICILFHPSLLSSCKKIFQNYIAPLLNKESFSYLHLQNPEHTDILQYIFQIWQLEESKNAFYLLDIIGAFYSLWSCLSQKPIFNEDTFESKATADVIALRKMISYIHSHYQENISLQSIASEANICKSKCCKVFKAQVGQSPIDFLNTYRLHITANQLRNTSGKISDIAFHCGFNHLSYYSKLFMRHYGCTPTKYRQLKS